MTKYTNYFTAIGLLGLATPYLILPTLTDRLKFKDTTILFVSYFPLFSESQLKHRSVSNSATVPGEFETIEYCEKQKSRETYSGSFLIFTITTKIRPLQSICFCQEYERTTPVKCVFFYVSSVQYWALSSHSLLMHLQPLIGKSMSVACLEFLVSV